MGVESTPLPTDVVSRPRDGAANEPASRPAVIPTSQVVILREDELDCDLATAIQRVRDSADTARSRILVVGPDEGEDVRVDDAVAERVVPRTPTTIGQVVRRAEEAALRRTGERFDGLVQCLERFLEEARWAVRDLRSGETWATAFHLVRDRVVGLASRG